MATILEDAARRVDEEAEDEYGHPIADFSRVTEAARALGLDPSNNLLHHPLYVILMKISRLIQTPDHRDSIVDIAGYARTYEKCLEALEYEQNEALGILLDMAGVSDQDQLSLDGWEGLA